ncbi:protein of unknown function [Cribrihabitans marinus]|uniref:DUF4381 domain-containing protein n=1 Tax=Cribrihabitans marinus TaxID=1227549 RepID=A0A1H6W5N3_9RHOB|nr:DUF4381 domain-containing protein [Cribrihabitans marinus]GGH25004.1 hypothetical protein GCM10010973_11860 [Cribrihabitans marinus]SEJ09377.1 protein of unknown function [Cribrihabitans marinus]
MSGAAAQTTADEGAAMPENLVDLIGALIDPPEPAPVPLTPQTGGWLVLALLVVVLAGWLVHRWIARRRANAYRRDALARVETAQTAAEIATILRRAALAAYPRGEVAGLTGSAWLTFLERTGREGFPAAAGAELRSAPYRAETAAPSTALRDAAAAWLRGHSRTAGEGAR